MKNRSKNLSIIDRDLEMDGTITSKGCLVVRGCLRGILRGEEVVIAEEGSIHGEARVASMTIGGVFEGDVRAGEALIILSTGSCSGTVTCKDLIIESGGLLNAAVTSLTFVEVPKLEVISDMEVKEALPSIKL